MIINILPMTVGEEKVVSLYLYTYGVLRYFQRLWKIWIPGCKEKIIDSIVAWFRIATNKSGSLLALQLTIQGATCTAFVGLLYKLASYYPRYINTAINTEVNRGIRLGLASTGPIVNFGYGTHTWRPASAFPVFRPRPGWLPLAYRPFIVPLSPPIAT